MPPAKHQRIIGIDPGLQKTGWGIVDYQDATLKLVAFGLIKSNTSNEMGYRLQELSHALRRVIQVHEPTSAAIEDTFVNQNPMTSLKLGMARGALILTLADAGLQVMEYSPNEVKKSVVGKGHAAKEQIQMMVKMLLPACGPLGPDEADALAIAITHAHHGDMIKRTSAL